MKNHCLHRQTLMNYFININYNDRKLYKLQSIICNNIDFDNVRIFQKRTESICDSI